MHDHLYIKKHKLSSHYLLLGMPILITVQFSPIIILSFISNIKLLILFMFLHFIYRSHLVPIASHLWFLDSHLLYLLFSTFITCIKVLTFYIIMLKSRYFKYFMSSVWLRQSWSRYLTINMRSFPLSHFQLNFLLMNWVQSVKKLLRKWITERWRSHPIWLLYQQKLLLLFCEYHLITPIFLFLKRSQFPPQFPFSLIFKVLLFPIHLNIR